MTGEFRASSMHDYQDYYMLLRAQLIQLLTI